MKIAVVGSREFKYKKLVETIITQSFKSGDIFISGGARGVDTFAEETINRFSSENPNSDSIEKIIFKPDWNRYGKRAGFLRNELIINEADKIIAFWDGQSKGTKHSIDLAIKQTKPVDIYIRQCTQ